MWIISSRVLLHIWEFEFLRQGIIRLIQGQVSVIHWSDHAFLLHHYLYLGHGFRILYLTHIASSYLIS